jgi:4-hydroxy-tetrahydrodipicolinate synthase
MKQDAKRFQGLFVPHVTPFDDSGAVDLGSLERLTAHLVSRRGVSGLVSCARIGEGPVLANEEKRSVYRVAGDVAREAGRIHIAAISPQSTQEAIALLRELEHLPVDAVMIFPPLLFAWGKVEGELKVRFFKDLAAASQMPLVLFQVPVASYWYDPETICRIAEIDRVVAFKEASFNVDLFTDTVRRLSERGAMMEVLTGNDRFVAESYRLGAKGALIGVSNLATEKWGAMDEAGRAGEYSEAMALQEELAELKELVFSEPIVEAVSRIKTILQHEGLIRSAVVRKPQLGVSEEEKSKLIRIYDTIAPKMAGHAKRAAV